MNGIAWALIELLSAIAERLGIIRDGDDSS